MHEFVYSFSYIYTRIKNSNQVLIKEQNKSIFKKTIEYNFAEDLLSGLNIGFPEEKVYLSACILGLSVGNLNHLTTDRPVLLDLVKGIIDRFENLAGIRFMEPQKVIAQLYMHFRPAYYRMLFKLPIVNPMMHKIKKEYKELYKLVKETLKPFASVFENEIPSEEIAYLTIHFASIISSTNEEYTEKKVALIVCPNGVGTSAILYKELRNIFPEIEFLPPIEIEQLETIQTKIDILFSTVPSTRLIIKKTPLVIVNPIMTSLEKYNVVRNVYAQLGNPVFNQPSIHRIMSIIESYADVTDRASLENSLFELFTNNKIDLQEVIEPVLSDITNEYLIQLDVEATDWQDAIRKSGQPLVKEGKVSLEYIQAMIDTASESGPYIVIAQHVALPHARPESGSKEIGISITKLKNPINFGNSGNDPVKYVFCLSAIDNETHLVAMAELVELLEYENFYKKLDEAKNPKEVYEFILEYEKRGELK